MNIRGIQKFTVVDYPGKLAAVLFCGGCNLRCPYCHNPCLVLDPESQPAWSPAELLRFLERRRSKLDGVVFSGGEPTLQPDLIEFAGTVKALDYAVKLDTNGSHPEVVAALHAAGYLDAVGVDYKAPAERYTTLTGCTQPDLSTAVHRTIHLALSKALELDVRTTVHRALLSPSDLATMAAELTQLGVKTWTLQQFHPVELIDDQLATMPTYSDRELTVLAHHLGPQVRVRGLTGLIL